MSGTGEVTEPQTGGVAVIRVMGERIAKLEGVRFQGIHLPLISTQIISRLIICWVEMFFLTVLCIRKLFGWTVGTNLLLLLG